MSIWTTPLRLQARRNDDWANVPSRIRFSMKMGLVPDPKTWMQSYLSGTSMSP